MIRMPRHWHRWWSLRPLFRGLARLRRVVGHDAPVREAVELLGLPREGRVLDLGCGYGFHLALLAPEVGEVVAVDTDAERVEAARAAIRDRGFVNVRVLRWDGVTLPFETGSFDGVLCARSLSAVPDHRRTLDEAVRVLRPGGCLAAADYLPPTGPWNLLGWLLWPLFLLAGANPNRPLGEDVDRRIPLFAHHVRLGGLFFVAAGRKPALEEPATPEERQPEASDLVSTGS